MAYAEKRVSQAKGSKGKVSWRSRYKKPDGTWGSEPGFPTKKTAENWGEEQEAAIRAGRWIDPDLSTGLFGVWAREWMAAKAPRGRTITTRWDRLDTHLLPKWEHTPLNKITWFEAETWANAVSLTHDDVTASQCLTLMSQIMTGAVDADRILVNPLAGRRRSKSAAVKERIRRKEQAKAERPAVSPEALLRIARRVGRLNGTHMIMTGFVGPRWGEGLAFTRDSLGERREPYGEGWFTCPVLQVRQEVAEYQTRDPATGKRGPMFFGLEPVKTDGSLRDIDLPPFLHAMVLEGIELLPPQYEYLYCTPNGKWWRNSNFGRQVMRPAADGREERKRSRGRSAREAWEPLCPGLNMDLLRHLHDSLQAEIGVKEPLAFEQAGHRRPGIKRVYQHPTPTMRMERLNGLQEIFERAMKSLGWESVWDS
ncbi:hypothetical protein [Streptomyces sp. NPDC052496]|uniref:hypothetical protein n=1 Tax=Streptomyces sp. NPDC052496 TaxID=3154951 RepID=UPI00342D99AC